MVTFNFSNVTGDAFAQRQIVFTGSTLSVVRNGTNPLVLTSSLTGEGLPGDTMKFTVTATTPLYRMAFIDNLDLLEMSSSAGSSFQTGAYIMNFDAGSGLTRLSNISFNGGAGIGIGGVVRLLTESGSRSVGSATGTFAGEFTGIRFTSFFGIDVNSITGTPTCFAKGTQIATPGGDVEVQDLAQGDRVLSHDGSPREVLWVGRQSFDLRVGLPEHLRLVRVQAGALGGGLPKRDLVLTADHALLVGDTLMNAGMLVKDDTIRFEPIQALPRHVTVYHVETEDHAIILAEGAPAETFVDARQRAQFDNYDEYLDLYGADRMIPPMTLPRTSAARLASPDLKRTA